MCFSATASFTSSAVLLTAGLFALSRVRTRFQLPYALIPLIFAIQQLLEGMLWISLTGDVQLPSCVSNAGLTTGYSVFSQVFWPLYVPVAVYLIENVRWRKKMLLLTIIAGALVSGFLLYEMIGHSVIARLQDQHIAYDFSHAHVVVATALYLTGACLAPILSGHVSVRWFGVVAFLSAILAFTVFEIWFISVWCYFAGLMSCLVLFYFFKEQAARQDNIKV